MAAIDLSNMAAFPTMTRRHALPASTLLVLVLAIGMAIFLGLLTPLLGLESWIGLAVILAGFSILLTAFGILFAGVQGRHWAIWFVFFVVAVVMEGTLRRRELTSTGMDGQTLFKLLVWAGGFVIGAAHYSYVKLALQRSLGLRWLLGFGVWALISTFYSLTPTYTFGGGFAFLALIFFVASVIERTGAKSVLMPMIFACGLLTVTAAVLYVVAPSIAVAQLEGGSTPRLAGLTGSPNNLGRVASLGLLFIFFAVQQRLIRLWRLDIALIAISCLACLALSWSRTSIAALIISILVVKLRRRPWLLLGAAVLTLTAFLLLLVSDFNWNNLVKLISRRGSIEELLTFTGRTAIWDFNWQKFLQQPIIGYGYGATKLLLPAGFRTYFGWTTTSAHSMILQAIVTTGLVGGLFVIATLIWQLKAFFRQPADFPDAIFVYVVLSGLLEAGAVGVAPNMLTFIWVMSLAIPRSPQFNSCTKQHNV
jgi:exopolysaccharide production protein ExoQ